jgi:hypothetical protein
MRAAEGVLPREFQQSRKVEGVLQIFAEDSLMPERQRWRSPVPEVHWSRMLSTSWTCTTWRVDVQTHGILVVAEKQASFRRTRLSTIDHEDQTVPRRGHWLLELKMLTSHLFRGCHDILCKSAGMTDQVHSSGAWLFNTLRHTLYEVESAASLNRQYMAFTALEPAHHTTSAGRYSHLRSELTMVHCTCQQDRQYI